MREMRYVRGRAARKAWSDDDLLTRTVTAPFGEVPGAVGLGGFLMETLAHGRDLAVATGQPCETDPEVVAKAQSVADFALPAEARGPGIPFDAPVEPRTEAGPTERLAAYLGRRHPAA